MNGPYVVLDNYFIWMHMMWPLCRHGELQYFQVTSQRICIHHEHIFTYWLSIVVWDTFSCPKVYGSMYFGCSQVLSPLDGSSGHIPPTNTRTIKNGFIEEFQLKMQLKFDAKFWSFSVSKNGGCDLWLLSAPIERLTFLSIQCHSHSTR